MATETYFLDQINKLYEYIADLQIQINYLKTKIDVLEIEKEDKQMYEDRANYETGKPKGD